MCDMSEGNENSTKGLQIEADAAEPKRSSPVVPRLNLVGLTGMSSRSKTKNVPNYAKGTISSKSQARDARRNGVQIESSEAPFRTRSKTPKVGVVSKAISEYPKLSMRGTPRSKGPDLTPRSLAEEQRYQELFTSFTETFQGRPEELRKLRREAERARAAGGWSPTTSSLASPATPTKHPAQTKAPPRSPPAVAALAKIHASVSRESSSQQEQPLQAQDRPQPQQQQEQQVLQQVLQQQQLEAGASRGESRRERVHVVCRLKPSHAPSVHSACVSRQSPTRVRAGLEDFAVDCVETGDQLRVYSHILPAVQALPGGRNACLFVIGPAGSGKSHTLHGSRDQPGVLGRAVEELLATRSTGHGFRLFFSAAETSDEQTCDLGLLAMGPSDTAHARGEDGAHPAAHVRSSTFIPHETEIGSMEEFVAAMEACRRLRAPKPGSASTERAACAHEVTMLTLRAQQLTASMTMVELAAEELLQGGPDGESATLATIRALTCNDPDDAAPREGSPLAALVARSLLGDANVTLVVTCQPEQAQVDAAARALRFAASVKQPTLLATPPTLKHDAAPALTPEMPSELVEPDAQMVQEHDAFGSPMDTSPSRPELEEQNLHASPPGLSSAQTKLGELAQQRQLSPRELLASGAAPEAPAAPPAASPAAATDYATPLSRLSTSSSLTPSLQFRDEEASDASPRAIPKPDSSVGQDDAPSEGDADTLQQPPSSPCRAAPLSRSSAEESRDSVAPVEKRMEIGFRGIDMKASDPDKLSEQQGGEETEAPDAAGTSAAPVWRLRNLGDSATCRALQEFDIDAHPTRHAMQSSANSILAAALSEASRLEAAEARMLAKSQKSLTSGPDHAVTASSALRRLQPVVFPFLHRLQPHEVLDSTLVGLVYHRYIADLIARAPARSALEPQALPVSFFLAKKPTTRWDATPMPGVLVVNIEEQPARQGSFQRSPSSAERPASTKRRRMCACACAGGADQEPAHNDKAGECYLSSMQLLQLKDDAECSAVGNYLLAAALAGSAPHIVSMELQKWLRAEFPFLVSESVSCAWNGQLNNGGIARAAAGWGSYTGVDAFGSKSLMQAAEAIVLGWLEGLCHKIMGDEPAGAGAKDWQKDLGAIVGKCALEVVLASYAWCNYLSQITEVDGEVKRRSSLIEESMRSKEAVTTRRAELLGLRERCQMMSKSFERDERLSSDSKGRGRKLLASLLAQIRLQLAALAPAMNGFDGASQVDVWDGTNFVSGVFSSRQSLDRFDRVPAVDPTPQDPQPSETSSVVASMEELGGSDAARPDNYDLDAVHKTTEDEAGALRDRIEALTSKVELALLTPDMLPTPRREPREAQSLAADVEARSAHELLHARQRTPDSSPPVSPSPPPPASTSASSDPLAAASPDAFLDTSHNKSCTPEGSVDGECAKLGSPSSSPSRIPTVPSESPVLSKSAELETQAPVKRTTKVPQEVVNGTRAMYTESGNKTVRRASQIIKSTKGAPPEKVVLTPARARSPHPQLKSAGWILVAVPGGGGPALHVECKANREGQILVRRKDGVPSSVKLPSVDLVKSTRTMKQLQDILGNLPSEIKARLFGATKSHDLVVSKFVKMSHTLTVKLGLDQQHNHGFGS